MAERGDSNEQNISFKAIQLFKDQTLGIGSYGAVCKARCDDLVCAAKILHPTLFDPIAHQQIARRREHRLPIKRFEQECEFMSAIRHPNIVQYLCTHRDPDTGLPVLLMELMDKSLTLFLESSTQPIPYHIQVNICHDITLALSFLHSNNIVHRDLSGNNVLLIGNIRAKVTDFGMARLGDLNPQATRLTFTMCPGTDVYMPPETVRAQPVYSEKVDCFSFGVIIVQTLSRQVPKPGDRLKTVRINDPQFHGGEVEVRVSEIERRHNHISQIDNNQPLMQIALDCLKDSDHQRPSTQQLQERVAVLKESPEYIESARPIQEILDEKDRQIQEAQEQVQTLSSDIETKEHTIQSKEQIIRERNWDIEAKNVTIATLEGEKIALHNQLQSQQQQHQEIIKQKDQLITAKELAVIEKEKEVEIIQIEKSQLQTRLESQQQAHSEEISRRNHIISSKEETIASKDKQIGELKRAIKSKEEQMHQEIIHQQRVHMEEISKKNGSISTKDAIIADKSRQIEELEQTTRTEEEQLHRKILDHQQKHLQEVTQKNKTITSMEETIAEKDRQIREFQTSSVFSERKTTNVCTFGRLLEVLRPCSHKWYQLGFYLGVKSEDLNSMMRLKHPSEHLLYETLKLRLKGGEKLTWGDVVIALFKAGEEEIAQEVAKAQDNGPTVDYKTQKTEISGALQQRLKQGDTWYLVDVKWMKQWKKYVGYDQRDQKFAGQEAANPGPLDNTSLFRNGAVRDHLIEELNYFLLPEAAWTKLTSWYGLSQNSRPLARRVVEHGMYIKYCKVEVYLLEFKLSQHPYLNSTKPRSFSRGDTVGYLEAVMKEEFNVERYAECRVWHRFMTNTYELLSNRSQTLQEAGLYNGQTIVLEKKNKDGSWPRQAAVHYWGLKI